MAQLFNNEDTLRAFAGLATISIPLGGRVMQYVGLFTPPKTRLTVPKQVRLIQQLLPDLKRQAIAHRGREWHAPPSAWEAAIDQMLAARAAGRLELPMTGHGYLYAILAGLADKVEGQAERQVEADRREPPRQDSVQVRGESMPIGQALATVYGQRDPALVKIEHDARQAAPVPDSVRALRDRLKGGG